MYDGGGAGEAAGGTADGGKPATAGGRGAVAGAMQPAAGGNREAKRRDRPAAGQSGEIKRRRTIAKYISGGKTIFNAMRNVNSFERVAEAEKRAMNAGKISICNFVKFT